MALTDFLSGIADAIRSKDGTTDLITATDFPQRILDIPSGGGGELPDSIKTGTFTVAEDTFETITIPHGLGATPTMLFIFSDNLEYAIGNIPYAFLGLAYLTGLSYVTAYNSSFTTKGNVFTVSCDDTNIVISTNQTNYKFIAGVTYRWFVWG